MNCACGEPSFSKGKCQDCLRIGLRFNAVARPIREVPKKPVERKTRSKAELAMDEREKRLKRRIEMLQKLQSGERLVMATLRKLQNEGYIKLKLVPELVLTEKGRKILEYEN